MQVLAYQIVIHLLHGNPETGREVLQLLPTGSVPLDLGVMAVLGSCESDLLSFVSLATSFSAVFSSFFSPGQINICKLLQTNYRPRDLL